MQQYVVGFLFRKNKTEVALIEKEKPTWQKGKFNGIGGKIEPGETNYAAMRREFREEAGADIADWVLFADLQCGDAQISFFRSEADVEISTETEEAVWWVPVSFRFSSPFGLPKLDVIPNLHWLVPMAADADGPYANIVSGFSGS